MCVSDYHEPQDTTTGGKGRICLVFTLFSVEALGSPTGIVVRDLSRFVQLNQIRLDRSAVLALPSFLSRGHRGE